MDALTSFTHLSDNIPDWLTKLDELAAQVAEQHTRFTRMTQFSEIKLTRGKHDSTESLRPKAMDNELDDTLGEMDPPIPRPSQLSSPNVDQSTSLKDNRRKRKSASTASGASGPQRYRTRSMIIVYYDSAIQEAFESLVRMIASARNNLRKGKTASSFKVRMASLGMAENMIAGDFSMLSPKKTQPQFDKSSRQSSTSPSQTPSFPAFDDADKDLETAQGLCEVAAHQFLRDGDCDQEIQGAKKRFQSCLSIAHREMEKIKAQSMRESSEVEEEEGSRVSSNEESKPQRKSKSEQVEIPSEKPVDCADVGVIEVDNESDASSVLIDLSAFRRNRRG